MKNFMRKSVAVLSCAAALALAACTTEPTAVFDTTRPWHDTGDSYEKLTYAVSVYNTEAGTGKDERVTIASGKVTFVLKENVPTTDTLRHTELTMDMSFTFNDDAPEADRGCTDEITSRVEWQSESLVTATAEKTVKLQPREGEETNLSYTIKADYLGEKKATREMYGATSTMDIPTGQYYDNEMMFYLARTSSIADNTSLPFKMTTLFDCFETGKYAPYTMLVRTEASKKSEDIGDWVAEFGIEAVTSDDGTVSYPIACFDSSIVISADRHGPPYYVSYSSVPFKKGDKEHLKLPVRMRYDSYLGGVITRQTEYVLTSCSFEENEE